MLHFFYGSDRAKSRAELHKALRALKGADIARITDANSIADLRVVLGGGGMFARKRAVVLDGVCANEEMRTVVLDSLRDLKESDEQIYILEEKLDAETRKKIEKYAAEVTKFEAKKEKEQSGIFALAYALKSGDKKKLWIEYQRALLREEAPEAIHGVLFWGAKDMFLKSSCPARSRAGTLVADLAALPHEARRRGFDLEYAIEQYVLSVNKM